MMTTAYDPTRDALYHPERRPPQSMIEWAPDQIAAEFSRLAYFRFESVPAQKAAVIAAIGAIGYGGCGWFEDARARAGRRFDAQGFGAVRDGHAIIAFRGTQADSFRDILTDARILPVRWAPAGWVHVGFRDALLSILPQIEAWLAETRVDRLTLTGHSLGAALASLLASREPAAELVTFGSPRVGDGAFAASFRNRAVRRYVDCTDIVTHVPLPPFYAHIDGLRYIDHRGKLHDGEHPALSLAADYAAAEAAYFPLIWHPDNVHLRSFADHAPINYVTALRGTRTGP